MKMRYNNPEGDTEYLEPGDELVFTTDMTIFAFSLPGRAERHGEVKTIVEVSEGDIIRYIGASFKAREFSVTKTVPLYEFALVYTNDKGEVVSELRFVIKNVETILKWTERL